MNLTPIEVDILIASLESYVDRNYDRGNRDWAILAQKFLNRIRQEQKTLEGIKEKVIEDIPIIK